MVLGKDRLWSLAYADDIILLAKNEVALEDMTSTLKGFLRDRSLVLNVEKTKIVVFNRTKRTKSKGKDKSKWRWGKKCIEEVKSFKYLGFIFNEKGNYADHIKDLSRKGRIVANKVWGLGERICRDDFCRRWMLYKYLVQSVMAYGVEIWG